MKIYANQMVHRSATCIFLRWSNATSSVGHLYCFFFFAFQDMDSMTAARHKMYVQLAHLSSSSCLLLPQKSSFRSFVSSASTKQPHERQDNGRNRGPISRSHLYFHESQCNTGRDPRFESREQKPAQCGMRPKHWWFTQFLLTDNFLYPYNYVSFLWGSQTVPAVVALGKGFVKSSAKRSCGNQQHLTGCYRKKVWSIRIRIRSLLLGRILGSCWIVDPYQLHIWVFP